MNDQIRLNALLKLQSRSLLGEIMEIYREDRIEGCKLAERGIGSQKVMVDCCELK